MWFGSRKGLNRFDGYATRVFKNTSDPFSIGSNSILSLYEDPKERLWVGTDKGIYLYDPRRERFSLFEKIPPGAVRSIYACNRQDVWINSNNKLYKFSSLTNAVDTVAIDVARCCVSGSGMLWAATIDGVLKRYNHQKKSFDSYCLRLPKTDRRINDVRELCCVDDSLILIGTLSHAYAFDTKSATLVNLFGKSPELSNVQVHTFIRHSPAEVWVGTETGLYIYNLLTKSAKRIQKQYNTPYAITDNVILSFCKDREGGTWIGTFSGGVNYYSRGNNFFRKYFPLPASGNSINGNIIHEITADQKGSLWIGTEDAGLNKLDLTTGRFHHYKPGKQKGSLTYSNIHGLLAAGNELWIGTLEHGLDVMNIASGKVIRHYESGNDSTSLKSSFVITLYKTRKGDLLVGTRSGLFKYNKSGDNFSPVPYFNMHIKAIHEDDEGTLWIGSHANGVFYRNAVTGEYGNLQHEAGNGNSLVNNQINSFYEDHQHNLWICTDDGLSCYNPATRKFVNFTTQNDLPDNQVFCALEDDEKNTWISTARGLTCFHPSDSTLYTYKEANGLPSEQFNYHSAYKHPNGNLFFGTVRGMISFNPNSLQKDTLAPPVYITNVQINNADLAVGDEALAASTLYTGNITLPYDRSSVNLDVAALSYTSPELNQYMYTMERFDKGWTLMKSNRRIYYPRLPAGTYLFRVKGASGGGTWSAKETTLAITVRPAVWATNAAYVIYLILCLLIVATVLRYYFIALTARNNRKIDLFEREREREIYKAKIEFFTNVAHEIRTPLTLIKMPLDKLLNKLTLDAETKESLHMMQKNTNRLIGLTNQLLDFRKAEANNFSLTFTKADVNEILAEMHAVFKPAAEQKGLQFSLELPRVALNAFVDEEAAKKIISNLISNAVKYAEKKVSVRLLPFSSEDTFFHAEFKNDGHRIPDELKTKIFEPFFRIKETEKEAGTGIGLPLAKALAELHGGKLELKSSPDNLNLFLLSLPIHQDIQINLKNDGVDEDRNTPAAGTPANSAKDALRPVILLVEDNKEILLFIQRELSTGYQIRIAVNGQDAITVLEKENVQLVISDIMMPVMDGIDLCKKIKTDIHYSHIPIILLTAKNSLHARIEGLEAGADAYIEKPFSFEHLQAQVTNLITNRNIIKEHFARSPLTHLKGIAYSPADKIFIEMLNAVIEQNITKADLEVEQLSRLMNMSRPTLYRKIKALSNLTPNELINLSRLKRAAELLAEGKYKINEVAFMVGYSIHTNFSRDFNKQFGVTPSAYITNLKSERAG